MAYTSQHTGTKIDGFDGRITTIEGKTGYLPANNTGTIGQYLQKTSASEATWADASTALIFNNKVIATSAWTADNTYSDFPYKADISCSGVTSDYYCEVVFNVTEAISGNYAPVCLSDSNIVRIYAVEIPQSSITIPTIKCSK